MSEEQCACSKCECSVSEKFIEKEGQKYCCEACASGHADGQVCECEGCGCN